MLDEIDHWIAVAATRTVPALQGECLDYLHRRLGCAAGFYLFAPQGSGRRSCVSEGVAWAFLDEYEAHIRPQDVVLQQVLRSNQAASGQAVLGRAWHHSAAARHLRRWGLGHNMQGPLLVRGSVVGTLNVATGTDGGGYRAQHLQRFTRLCQAASAALAGIDQDEALHTELQRLRAAHTQLAPADVAVALPPRARQVAQLLCEGQPNKVIARQMGISEHTVKEHIANLSRRFGALNRTDLARRLGNPLFWRDC